jgi:NADH-ubiquinone oxidoreductase chain 4
MIFFILYNMITTLLLIPLIGVILLLPLNENSTQSKVTMKQIALCTSMLNLFISIIIWWNFDFNSAGYQFVYEFNQLNFCHIHIGIDGISLYFVLLTTFITPLCILSNWTDITNKLKYFLISFLILETLQIAVFVVLDLFLFYIFFESVLIPLFFIIIIWGGSDKKYRAAFLLFLYTLAGSLFMLLAILYIYQNTGSTDFLLLSLSDINYNYQKLLWLSPFFSKRNMTACLINKTFLNI